MKNPAPEITLRSTIPRLMVFARRFVNMSKPTRGTKQSMSAICRDSILRSRRREADGVEVVRLTQNGYGPLRQGRRCRTGLGRPERRAAFPCLRWPEETLEEGGKGRER